MGGRIGSARRFVFEVASNAGPWLFGSCAAQKDSGHTSDATVAERLGVTHAPRMNASKGSAGTQGLDITVVDQTMTDGAVRQPRRSRR